MGQKHSDLPRGQQPPAGKAPSPLLPPRPGAPVDSEGVPTPSEVGRRSFFKTVLSAAVAGSQISTIPAIATGAGQGVISNARDMIDTLNKLLYCEHKLWRLVNSDIKWLSSAAKLGLGLKFEGDTLDVNASKVRPTIQELCRVMEEQMNKLLQVREATLAELHARGEHFLQLKAAIEKDCKIDFGQMSAVLSDKNARVSANAVKHLASQESREITDAVREDLLCEAREVAKWSEPANQQLEVSPPIGDDVLDRIAFSFSPEMYTYSSMPASRFSLTVEDPRFAPFLYDIFTRRVDEELDQGNLPLDLQAVLSAARIEHLFSSQCNRGDAYLEIIESYHDALPERKNGERDEFELYRDPRAEMGRMLTANQLQFLDFKSLREQPSRAFIRYISDENGRNWVGPLACRRGRTLVHDLLAQVVVELTAEKRLFFLGHPVGNLAHFKAIARDYRDSSQFAKTFLDVVARLLLKGCNISDYFQMMRREYPSFGISD